MNQLSGRGPVQSGASRCGRPPRPLPGIDPAYTCVCDLPWYVVHAKARQEGLARDNLERQGYSVYLPQIKVLKRLRGRYQGHLEPLFPRYLFVQPGSPDHSIAPVRSTFGVSGIVRFGQEPAVMRAESMRAIREFEARQIAARDEDISPFRCDERVRVIDGPLAGLEGLITDVARDRVVVLMNLLGQETRVRMSQHQLLLTS